MKIRTVESWRQSVRLTHPYTIATRTIDAVDLFYLRITTDNGHVGLGSTSPNEAVTGETSARCEAALAVDGLQWLVGENPRAAATLRGRLANNMATTPAARSAVDIALHDLFAQIVGLPLADILGRCHSTLPTSITIGIQSTEQTLAEAQDCIGRGFRHLKVKLGRDLAADVERLTRLRETVGHEVKIRVDANQGYTADEIRTFGPTLVDLDLEFIEQPLPADADEEMRALPASLRRLLAADESLCNAADALRLARPPAACGILNIKLNKCGGIDGAADIAAVAAAADLELMWGCGDESVISIAAALHTAFASPATRYLDLDGSFDLSNDLATGGFLLEGDSMRTLDEPGLGVHLRD